MGAPWGMPLEHRLLNHYSHDVMQREAAEEITHKGCYRCRAARQPRANRQQALPVFIGTAPPLIINPASKGRNLSVRKWCFVCTMRGVRLEAALVPPCPTPGGSGPFVEALGYGGQCVCAGRLLGGALVPVDGFGVYSPSSTQRLLEWGCVVALLPRSRV